MRSASFVGVACWLAAATATAQTAVRPTDPKVDIQLFYPSPGLTSFFATESGEINGHLNINTGITFTYCRECLSVVIVDEDGNETEGGKVIENRFDINLMAAIGLFDYVDFGIVFPLVAQGGFQGDIFDDIGLGTALGQGPAEFTQGDLRLVPKVRPFSLADGLFAMSIIPGLVLPTGVGAEYAGERGVVFQPAIALSTKVSIFRAALNFGFRWRDQGTQLATVVIKDEFFANLAAAVNLNFFEKMPFEIVAEVFGKTPAKNGFGLGSSGAESRFQEVRTSIELDLGVRMTVLDAVVISVGGGGGLTPGIGSPAPRMFAGATYYIGHAGPGDGDQDGVIDDSDKCPDRKEDRDEYEDGDGCPELDNDKDNILDEDDQCPLEIEDRDGFNDEDGCPEPDNDNDGTLDATDQCPTEAEDVDQFQDDDGCADLDNDGDGIADKVDQCPLDAEDKDGFNDFDGCPEPDNDDDGMADINDLCPNHAEDKDGVVDDDGCPEDNDGDGKLDADDKCPNQAEIYNGIDDDDGCPEKLNAKVLVEVTEDKIEIKETIFFATNKATIMSKSFGLLDQVAAVLKNYQHLAKVRIEGHTDSKGQRKKNLKLSQDRADSVKEYLLGKGVEAGRLDAVGYGPDKPIASNKSNKGREQNRRVEFVIVEQKPIGKDVSEGQAPPPPPAEPQIEFNLEGGAPPAAEPGPAAEPPPPPPMTTDEPLFEVGEEPAEEEGKGKGKGKKGKGKKKKEEEGEIEFNF